MLLFSSFSSDVLDSTFEDSVLLAAVKDDELLEADERLGLVVADVPAESALSKLVGGVDDCSCDFNTLFVELLPPLVELELVPLELVLPLPLPLLLLPLDEVEC